MSDNSFGKEKRLSGRKTIDALFANGDSGFVYPLRFLFAATENETPGVAVLVSVPKKNHKKAVARNLLKRRIREAFRTQNTELESLADGRGMKINIALLYVAKDIAEFEKIKDAVGKILTQIPERM